MAWTSPMTFSAGAVLTAAQLNTHLTGNMNETAPAKATSAGGMIVTTGANSIIQRTPTSATVATSQTTSTTSYTDLATSGPAVTVTTGTQAIVFTTSSMSHDTVGRTVRADFAISSATTRAAADTTALIHEAGTANQAFRATVINYVPLTAGSNVFTMKYRVTTGGVGTFNDRHIVVIPL